MHLITALTAILLAYDQPTYSCPWCTICSWGILKISIVQVEIMHNWSYCTSQLQVSKFSESMPPDHYKCMLCMSLVR